MLLLHETLKYFFSIQFDKLESTSLDRKYTKCASSINISIAVK